MKKIVIILLVMLLSGCVKNYMSSNGVDSEYIELEDSLPSHKMVLYETLSTDTVSSVAKKFNITPQQIITLNHLKKPYYIKREQLLKIPVFEDKESNFISDVDNLEKQDINEGKKVYIVPKSK